jgi:hypothetical protein
VVSPVETAHYAMAVDLVTSQFLRWHVFELNSKGGFKTHLMAEWKKWAHTTQSMDAMYEAQYR